MLKYLMLMPLFFMCTSSQAQMASLTNAKYMAVLKVAVNYKMGDSEIAGDLEKLRQSERFKKELEKIVEKLDNSKQSDAKNRRIMRILEQAGRDIYNELK
ncbi:MAG: hypothetical protein J6W96_00660 [Alphaproteobacteria bacterium]|nr:hypothetical protein [Alphaproteobacteria bacterium]